MFVLSGKGMQAHLHKTEHQQKEKLLHADLMVCFDNPQLFVVPLIPAFIALKSWTEMNWFHRKLTLSLRQLVIKFVLNVGELCVLN